MMAYMLETNKDKSKQIVLTVAMILAIVYCTNLVFRSATNAEYGTMDLSMRIISGILAVLNLCFLYGIWMQNIFLVKSFAYMLVVQMLGFVVYFILGIHWIELLPNLVWSIICLAIVLVYIKELNDNKRHQQANEQV